MKATENFVAMGRWASTRSPDIGELVAPTLLAVRFQPTSSKASGTLQPSQKTTRQNQEPNNLVRITWQFQINESAASMHSLIIMAVGSFFVKFIHDFRNAGSRHSGDVSRTESEANE